MNQLTKYLLAITIQISVIFLMIIFKLLILTGGSEVLLRIEPYDPTDPLRGDYATVRFQDLSELSMYRFNETPVVGSTVFVTLRKYGKTWDSDAVSLSKPEQSRNIVIKGVVTNIRPAYNVGGIVPPGASYRDYDTRVFVEYGIEDYFIEEGTGSKYDLSKGNLVAKVVIDDNGNSVLKSIEVDNDYGGF